jgi:hypothetical protein
LATSLAAISSPPCRRHREVEAALRVGGSTRQSRRREVAPYLAPRVGDPHGVSLTVNEVGPVGRRPLRGQHHPAHAHRRRCGRPARRSISRSTSSPAISAG